jgi:hypothetical protein
MKTGQLIESLAASVPPARARRLTWRLAAAAAAGGLVGLALAIGWFGLDRLADLVVRPHFWVRLALLAGFAWGSASLVEDFARPGATARTGRLVIVGGLLTVLALVQLALAPAALRPQLVMGSSWAACPWRVAAIALCALPLVLAAMRTGAPTHLRWAGAAAGALSGALGAMMYALFCREPGLAFVVLWYGAGILAMTALGAMVGPIALRWRDRPAA